MATRILAIETATDACSVALWQDGRVLERFEPGARRQTERVLPLVDAVLAEAGVRLADLDALGLAEVNRIAVSPEADRIAIVAAD